VPRAQIDRAFDLERQLRNVGKIFTRVFGAAAKPSRAKRRKKKKKTR
jgi:hypothetical protein